MRYDICYETNYDVIDYEFNYATKYEQKNYATNLTNLYKPISSIESTSYCTLD